jgi:PAS domain S-box-containing protein
MAQSGMASVGGRPGSTVFAVVPSMYAVRTLAFACAFAVVWLHLRAQGAGTLAYVLLVLQFLVYPAALYGHMRVVKDHRRIAQLHLHADSFFLGAWTAALGFPQWIGFCFVFTTMMNATIVQGAPGIARSAVALASGAIAGILVAGFRVEPATTPLVTQLSMGIAMTYLLGVGLIAYRRTASLIDARREQRLSEDRYRLIAENAGDLVLLVDKDCRLLYASPSCLRLLSEEQLAPGVDAFRGVVDEDWLPAWTQVRSTLRTGEPGGFDFRIPHATGMRALKASCNAARDDAGSIVGVVVAARDVTDLRHHEAQAQLAQQAFERMSECMLIADASGRIIMVNDAFSALTGYSRDEVLGRNEREFRSGLQPAAFYDALYAQVVKDGRWAGSIWSQKRGGALYREWRTVSAVRSASGEITHYVTLFFETGAPGAAARVA